MPHRSICLFLALVSLLWNWSSAQGREAQETNNTYIPAQVPDTAAGLQSQVDELVLIAKTEDQGNWRTALGTFSLPKPGAWFETNFDTKYVAQLTDDYLEVRDGHLSRMSGVIEHHQQARNFRIQVAPWETPAHAQPEGWLPTPIHPVDVQNFLLTPIADSGSMPPPWVSSFVYADGHFRVVGGTYPFWAEGLQQIRLPQGSLQAGRNLYKVPPEYPKKARKAHVEGVVRLHAIIGKDGAIRDLSVVSGDALLTDAAMKAVRQWRYEPTLLNGEPVEVDTIIDVIFSLNH